MTTTPRTDAVSFDISIPDSPLRYDVVMQSFARTLELELTAKTAELEEQLEVKRLGFEIIRRYLGITGEHNWTEITQAIALKLRDARSVAFEEAAEVVLTSESYGREHHARELRAKAAAIRKGDEK